MIRVWIPASFWAAVSAQADARRVRSVKHGGQRVQLEASAGGIEWVRRVAAEGARAAFAGAEVADVARVRGAQLTLAALGRLGWRPIADAETRVFSDRHPFARIDASVVPRIRCGWLQDLSLRPAVPERTGRGAEALRAVASWAASEGAEVLRLIAPKPTVGFWLRHGFEVASVDAGGRMRMVRELTALDGSGQGPDLGSRGVLEEALSAD